MHAKFFTSHAAAENTFPKEIRMGWSGWIRQFHRWIAILFTLTVLLNFAAMTQGQPPVWIVYSPLPPLFLLLFTGLYMFALPYVRRRGRS